MTYKNVLTRIALVIMSFNKYDQYFERYKHLKIVKSAILLLKKVQMVDCQFLNSNVYFAGLKMTVAKCIILDYYLAL